jgi:hypothetical protein
VIAEFFTNPIFCKAFRLAYFHIRRMVFSEYEADLEKKIMVDLALEEIFPP